MSETSRKIIEGVTELGAENGMYGMTSKAISKKCECSEGVIFKHFNTLEELKKEVYYNIDSEIYQSIKSVDFDELDVAISSIPYGAGVACTVGNKIVITGHEREGFKDAFAKFAEWIEEKTEEARAGGQFRVGVALICAVSFLLLLYLLRKFQ